MEQYDSGFFDNIRTSARSSSEVLVPLIIEKTQCKAVVDVGCGDGTWLSTFTRNGIQDFLGVDGSYVERDQLQIPAEKFKAHNLEDVLRLDRQFDLAMSLETAEHLSKERAASFVEDLTKLAPMIVFSAAIPHQGGTNHYNEQWPSYWVDIFERYDYQVIDAFRPYVWNHKDVRWFYAQNILLFVSRETLALNAELLQAREATHHDMLDVPHPHIYQRKHFAAQAPIELEQLSLRQRLRVVATFPREIIKAIGRKLSR